ncbi:MAG TPA: TonB-dependent receptor plug domain-containing protein [Flavitalea sp.]|nr:TonB-dependent receptor plug domain-containing protein [Flavitalea sp.]
MIRKSASGASVVICLFLMLSWADNAFAQGDTHSAVVKDKFSGQALSGATIQFLNSRFSVSSDSIGSVAIPKKLFEKEDRILVSMIGYKPFELTLQLLEGVAMIELERDAQALEEVLVTGNSALGKVTDLQMGADIISAMEAKRLPAILGEVDIIKILQLKPGVKGGGEGLSGFYVRGGGADQNQILLDDVPVYNPNHLLGLFSVFNNDAIRNAKLYKAAYPAKYSGRLSSVLDISSRPGSTDSLAVTGGIGILSSRVSVESPIEKGKSSFILSARRTYFDIFTAAMNKANRRKKDYQPIPDYFFDDINFRSDWKINRNNTLWLTAYRGRDQFSSDPQSATDLSWGNQLGSLNWKSLLNNKAAVTSTLFYSGYDYRLLNSYGYNRLELKSAVQTVGMKVAASAITEGPLRWSLGMDGQFHKLNIGDFKSSSELSDYKAGEKASGNEWGAFMHTEWDDGQRLALSGGLRVSGFYAGRKWQANLEPRFGARLNMGEKAALKASYTRMYQYLHLAALNSSSMPIDMWYPSTEKTLPQYADQVSFGWSESIGNNSFYFSLEGYYKWMNNQIAFRDGANIFGNPKLENDFVYGKGKAYGVESYIEKKNGRTTGWLGYTLSWSLRMFPDIDNGKPFHPRYDRRHDLSLVCMHKINKKLTLSGSWIYGSGAYITIPVGRFVFQDQAGRLTRSITPVYDQRGNYQLAPVHRLDLSLVIALKSRRGSEDITISLYNAYSRRNPYYISFEETNNKEGYVTSIEPTVVSLFPVLPGITYNFKF